MNDNPEQNSDVNEATKATNEAISGLAQNLGSIVLACSQADAAAKGAAAERLIKALNSGSSQITTTAAVVGMEEPLVASSELPNGAFVDSDSFVPDSMEFETSFNIATHDSEELSTDSKFGTKASVGGGFAGFTASVEVSADVGVKSDRKRSTDMSSSVDCKVVMKQKAGPEVFNRIIDAQLKMVDKVNDLNGQIIEHRLKGNRGQIIQDLSSDEGQRKMLSEEVQEAE